MFSPGTAAHGHSLRPKRTRQAAGADDSLKLPQAKRKRSALRKDTFEPLAEASLNEIAGRQPDVNGHAIGDEKAAQATNPPPRELTLRGGKKTEKRLERDGGTFTLTSNEFYNVAQLPALPDQIRNRPNLEYSCALSAEYGYAIALTHTDALVWNYNASATSPSTRDLISFKLPFPPAAALDPLPLAAFTARSAAGEPGLMVVSSKRGKIVYWETLANASSLVPGQTSSGVQGSIPSLLNGEVVREVVNAEPSGFILSTSHGRAVHVTVRDPMGRPGIGIHVLRRPASGTMGSLFGSIRHVFGGDRRKGVPIIKSGKSSKGQRDVIIASEDAELEVWNTNIGFGDSLKNSLGWKDDLLEALKSDLPNDTKDSWSFTLLDIDLSSSSPHETQAIIRHGDESPMSLTALASVTNPDQTRYYIIEAEVFGSTCLVRVVHPVKCYSTPILDSSGWNPKLFVSRSTSLALVVFERAIVLFSLVRPEESPSSQLLLERQVVPDPFQDCIKFQDDAAFRVLAVTNEERDKTNSHASLIFAVQNFGIVRLNAISPDRVTADEDEEMQYRISSKSKIEQAVFFGTLNSNPLDLTSSNVGQSFSAEEICNAAIEISSEILTSTSKYLPKSTPSIDAQMRLRAKALDDLAHYLVTHHSTSVSRATRFELLWHAEKLHAAHAIWKVQEDIERKYVSLKDREMPYLHFVLRALHESRQTYPNSDKGEGDRVRHWLIHDPDKLGHLVSEMVSCTSDLEPMDVTSPQVVAEYFREAEDIWIAAYEAAFKFREEASPKYGLGDEVFKDGVLQAGYPENTEQMWTTAAEPLHFGERFIFVICKFLEEWWDFTPSNAKSSKKKLPTDENGKPYEAPTKRTLADIALRLPAQTELVVRMLDENYLFNIERIKRQKGDGISQTAEVEKLTLQRRSKRRRMLTRIAHFNEDGAIKIAEKLGDANLLVTMNTAYIQKITQKKLTIAANDPAELQRLDNQLKAVQDHAETYYGTLGNSWAAAHFSRNLQDGDLGELLQEAQADDGKKQGYLTWFLRECKQIGQSVGKISWINDIVGEKSYNSAGHTLKSVSMREEEDLWGKRTEICLAKLANLAAAEDSDTESVSQSTRRTSNLHLYDRALEVMDIQQALLEHVLSFTLDAIDNQAAQELAFDVLGVKVVKHKEAFKSLFRDALDALISGKALTIFQLVDVLTLMDPVQYQGLDDQDDPGVFGHEFSLALRAVEASNELNQVERQALQRVIWRRAMIRDDWIKLNETNLQDDQTVQRNMEMSALFVTIAQVLQTHAQNPETGSVKFYSPEEVLDAELFPLSLQSRFEDDQLGRIEKDFQAEQDRLRSYVDKGRLEMHFEGLVRSAEEYVRKAADAQGDAVAREVLGSDRGREMDPIDLEDMQVSQTNGFH